MRRWHLRSGLLAGLIGGISATTAVAQDADSSERQAREVVQPAVLLLRVDRSHSEQPRVRVMEPAGLRWPLMVTQGERRSRSRLRGGKAELGDGYQLVRSWSPDGRSSLQYMIYHADLSHPNVAENWRRLRRAQYREAEREQEHERHKRFLRRRGEQLKAANREATYDGIALLRAGAYRQAAIVLVRAGELDQGDAGSRLHLALARMALGHDAEAAQALRRALELQPKLVPMQLNLADNYISPEEFARHVDALAERLVGRADVDGAEHFLLGFMEFQRGRYDAAHAALAKAAPHFSRDDRLKMLLSLTKPARH